MHVRCLHSGTLIKKPQSLTFAASTWANKVYYIYNIKNQIQSSAIKN